MERFLEWLKEAVATAVEFVELYLGKVSLGDLTRFTTGLALAVFFGSALNCGFWALLIVVALAVIKGFLFKWIGRAYYLRDFIAACIGALYYTACLLLALLLFS